MANLEPSTNQNPLFQKFFKKTNILLTAEGLNIHPPEIEEELEELFYSSRQHPKKAIPRLEALLKDYPHIPSIKNYLYVGYVQSNQLKKANRLLDQTIREHPKYIFGITNKILNLDDKDKLEKHAHLLGNPRDVRTLAGSEGPIHILAFVNYQMAAGYYEAMTGDQDSAIGRLESLMDVGADEESIDILARRITAVRFADMVKNLTERRKFQKSVKSFPKVKLPVGKGPPVLENPELEIFYQRSVRKFPSSKMTEIMALPRETLIPDLENILEDSIRRFDYFGKMDFDPGQHEFICHALYFLGALKSEKSLEKVLNLLRMGQGFTEYWFGDTADQFICPTLYYLGKNQLETLKAYVLEENLYAYDRLLVSHILAQVALQQPERRQEVIDWFGDVYNHFLTHPKNKKLIDTEFIGLSIGDVIDFRGRELIPLVEKMHENNWIYDDIQGNLSTIIKEIEKEPHLSAIKPLPLNIEEYYTEEYYQRKVPPPPLPEEEKAKFSRIFNNKAENLVLSYFTKLMTPAFSDNPPEFIDGHDDFYDDFEEEYDDYETPSTPVKRPSTKVGRNDPCPCGSGKKYKQCCWKKR